MTHIWKLVLKDLRMDFRNKYPFLSIPLYLAAIIYISYLSFQGLINNSIWNALFWMILLFTMVTAIGRSFLQEQDRSMYYYFLLKPQVLIASKLLYQILYALVLCFLAFILMQIYFPREIPNLGLFIFNLLLSTIGLSSAFTMVSSIASGASNQGNLMAVMGFPAAIPILVLAVTNSRKILMGASLSDIKGNVTTLVSIDVVIIALVFLLFPYSWKK